MAELLKQQYDIVVLKVQLLSERPNVRYTLQAKMGGMLSDLESWKSDTSDMGLDAPTSARSAGYEGVTGNLSHAMLDFIRQFFTKSQPNGRPLWVHLVKPYGALRFVPWERALGNALPVPILMLPDFIFPPLSEAESLLDVVLCGSAPLHLEARSVHEALEVVAHRILEASPRAMRLHVFADKVLTERLRDAFSDDRLPNATVRVYEPEAAAQYVHGSTPAQLVSQSGQLRSPWLRWMRDALRGQSIDVVHLVCHGYLRRDRGALLFAQSPLEHTNRYVAGPVGQTELTSFLTQTGAWSAAFTSLADNNSEPGLRDVADGIAQSRPGPMLMHTVQEDATMAAVADAYRFLYGVTPLEAPKSSSLYMYCQPHRLLNTGVSSAARRVRSATAYFDPEDAVEVHAVDDARTSPLEAVLKSQATVLPWVASTERFAEQVELSVAQSAAGAAQKQVGHAPDERSRIALATIANLRSAVAQLATSQLSRVERGDDDLVGGEI